MSNNDPLNNEISITTKIEDTGLAATVKSRAISALDRLVGNIINVPSAALERRERRLRLKEEINETIQRKRAAIDWEHSSELEKIEHSSEVYEKKRRISEQLNREDIVYLTIEDLSTNHETVNNNDNKINDEWMNHFAQYSSQASSENLQTLWSRLLAGEIRKPGEFSLTTLRIIAELDEEIANLFQQYAVNIIDQGYIIKDTDIKGQKLTDLIFLEEVGLLQDVSGHLILPYRKDSDNQIIVKNNDLYLIIKPVNDAPINVPLIKLTRAGTEILKLIAKEKDDIVLRKVADIAKNNATSISLARVKQSLGNRAIFNIIEKIK